MNPKPQQITWAAIFDVDGTMVDNRRFHEAAWLELGRRRGMPITSEFYRERIHSRSNAETAGLLLGPDADRDAAAALSAEKEALYRDLYLPEIQEIPGLTELLTKLAEAGIPCAAVSNSPPANVAMVIDELGIRARFACILDCTQAARGKPAPDLFLQAAKQIGIPIRHCLVLEDSVSGFAAAEAAGAPYVVVKSGSDPSELVHAHRPAAMVTDFTELSVEKMAEWATGGDPGAPRD